MTKQVNPAKDMTKQVNPEKDMTKQVNPAKDMTKQVNPEKDMFKFAHVDEPDVIYTWHPIRESIMWKSSTGHEQSTVEKAYSPKIVSKYIKDGTWVVTKLVKDKS